MSVFTVKLKQSCINNYKYAVLDLNIGIKEIKKEGHLHLHYTSKNVILISCSHTQPAAAGLKYLRI